MVHHDNKLGLSELLAIGIGAMVGGGIFSVLGIAVGISGHASPLAFVLGGFIALLTGYSYIKLALVFRDDGSSFTYFEHAFPKYPNIAGIMGWTIIVGYLGTLSLYAFTFGAYGADLLGSAGSGPVRMVLSAGVLMTFMTINLHGVGSTGHTEDIIVYTKIILLVLIGIAGLTSLQKDHLVPVFDRGISSVFISGAMVFVAFEGFELITNAINEIRNPEKDVPRSIYGSIIITTIIYLVIAFVAVGSLSEKKLLGAEEYALAVAAQPALGNAGRVLVSIAALLATSSAINATLFGASRMMNEMATQTMMPKAFSFRSRKAQVPWIALVTMTGLAVAFTMLNSLDTIAAFSSLTFLLVSLGVAIANLKLHKRTKSKPGLILVGILVVVITIILLLIHMWNHARQTFIAVGILYSAIFIAEMIFQKEHPTPLANT